MRRFAFATAEEFAAFAPTLEDGLCHVFENCSLPDGCTPNTARIGFEMRNGGYLLYIDKNIRYPAAQGIFAALLANGEAGFATPEEMAAFFHSLQPLFPIRAPVVDKEKLRRMQTETKEPKVVWPTVISARLKENIFGQDEVLEELSDKIVMNRMKKVPRLLTLGFIGPTATGKSETARCLAAVLTELYEEPCGFLEIAGSEFLGAHSVHRFFGAPPGFVGHGEPTLLEPVRQNPNHVVVINEIEKADEKLLVGLMEAIDTGKLGMADNSAPIDLSRCILLFTSNLPMDMEKYLSLPQFQRGEFCRDAFTRHCGRPEISGKIGSFLVFRPLTTDAVTDILVKFLRQALLDYDLTLVHVDEKLMLEFLRFETAYGARGIRDLVSDSLGRQLLRTQNLNELKYKQVALSGTVDNICFYIF